MARSVLDLHRQEGSPDLSERSVAPGTLAPVKASGRPITRLGLQLPNPLTSRDPEAGSAGQSGLLEHAAAITELAEGAGFDSVWATDATNRSPDVTQGGLVEADESDGTGSTGFGRFASPGTSREAGSSSMPGTSSTSSRAGVFRESGEGYEAYSLLGALATRTQSVRLGALPADSEPRSPSIVCKILTAVDVISHGRSILTLGSGSGAGSESIERLDEQLRVCRTILDDEYPEFRGRFFSVSGAVNRPPPVQRGGLPLVVVLGTSERDSPGEIRTELLRLAARFADALVLSGATDVLRETVTAMRELQRELRGEFPRSDLEVIWQGSVDTEREWERLGGSGLWGSPSRVAGEVRDRLLAGATGCIVKFAGPDLSKSVSEYGPALREAIGSI